MKILFMGNSYTYYNDLPALFEKLCLSNGKNVSVQSLTVGGRKLFENLDPDDEQCAKLTAYLGDGRPDVLFLQEQSVLPAVNFDLFFQGVKGLYDTVSAQRTILYATWGRQTGSETLAAHGWTKDGMTELLYASYRHAAEEIGGEVSPVGLCFREMNHKHPEVELYDPDGSHPSLYGSVLATVCHYYAVFGELPCGFDALEVDEDVLHAMEDVILSVYERKH